VSAPHLIGDNDATVAAWGAPMKTIKQLSLAETGFLPKVAKQSPQGGVSVRDAAGGAVVSTGGADRVGLPEERQRAPADAAGHDAAYPFSAAMVCHCGRTPWGGVGTSPTLLGLSTTKTARYRFSIHLFIALVRGRRGPSPRAAGRGGPHRRILSGIGFCHYISMT
jgi:hypothetical protein